MSHKFNPMEEQKKIAMNGSSKPKMLECNTMFWQEKSYVRRTLAELLPAPNAANPVISLGVGDPAAYPKFFGRSKCGAAVIASAASGDFYTNSPALGLLPARRAVADYLNRLSKSEPQTGANPVQLSSSDVILTVGATQAIHTILTILSSAGDSNILLPRPGFPIYNAACDLAGIHIRYYDLLPERCWLSDPIQIRAIADDRTRAIVVINPNNPSGAVYSAVHLRQIAEIAGDLNILVIADEVYGGLVFGCGSFVPMACFAGLAPVITVGSLSKRWMVPGWRLGWLAFSDPQGILQHVKEAIEILINLTLGPSSVIQAAVPGILSDSNEEFHENVNLLLDSCVDALFRGLEQIEALKYYSRPQGSMFTMVEVDIGRLVGIENDMDFAKELLKEESVLVLPGSIVGLKNWIRLFFALPPNLISEACERMKSFCDRRMKN